MNRLLHKVGRAIAKHALWSTGERVAVAVSGGRDSMALWDLLHELQGWHGGVLEAVTVDHGTRPGSAADADFVEARCQSCTRVTLALGPASEEECRNARYAALAALDCTVAVAHHRDDQAETVLVQLLRGTGTRGLAGMGWRRGRIVRPLLEVGRDELAAWAAFRHLAWVEDPTNADPEHLRNRVRHEVLPLLESIRPGASKALARSATRVAEDADVLAGHATDRLARALPEATGTHLDLLLDALERGEGAVELPGGRRLQISGTAAKKR